MTSVRITIADVEVEIAAAGAKAAHLAQIARAELDHALDRAPDGRLTPRPPVGDFGFHAELAPTPADET